MSRAYKFRDQTKPHFITLTAVGWVDLFSRKDYCFEIIESLQHCMKHKGLVVFAWVIMTNHLHLIIGTNKNPMQDIVRDFKSYTSRRFRILINGLKKESRRKWMLPIFEDAGIQNGNNGNWQFWQQHNHPIELWSSGIINRCLNYVHNNPVKAEYVVKPQDWYWSSAKDYAGIKGPLEIEFIASPHD